jgi:hypothetical protein
MQQVKIKSFGWRVLEESVRVLAQPLHRAHRVKVGCLHWQRPREQQQSGVLGPKVCAAMTGRDLVAPDVDARALHAGIARGRWPYRWRSDDLGEDAQEAGVDASQRSSTG